MRIGVSGFSQCRWFSGWQTSLLVVKPETVRWHRQGSATYWRRRPRRIGRPGRRPIAVELRTVIRGMTTEKRLWGQRRIQAGLTRLGVKISARTVAKYMQRIRRRGPSITWRSFLRQHSSEIWVCDFSCVRTVIAHPTIECGAITPVAVMREIVAACDPKRSIRQFAEPSTKQWDSASRTRGEFVGSCDRSRRIRTAF
jgi:hypothetical protein